MSDGIDDENDGNDSAGIAQLRASHKDQAKKLAALEQELNGYRSKERVSNVTEALKAKGVDSKFAKFYNNEDASPDAVAAWIDEQVAEGIFTASTNQQQQSSPNDANSNNARDISRMTNTNPEPSGPAKVGGQLVGDPEELMRLIQSNDYDVLVKDFGFPPRNRNAMS